MGGSEREYEVSNAKIVTDGGSLKLEFKVLNDTHHYRLAFYPNFGEYPPVLWGKLEQLDGSAFYPMFRKKEKKD